MIAITKPTIGSEEERAVLKVLRSKRIAQGEQVAEFEKKFANYIGTKYAIATSSGTTALHIALLAAGIGKDDEVITSPFSFIAASNACLYVGAKPVFVDIRAEDFNLNPNLIVLAITQKTKAILPVHLFGCPANMHTITEIARKYNLLIIEDACQAHGASTFGKKIGSFGLAGCFSFYATKNMTTGEGGMITTNNKQFSQKCYAMRSHGQSRKYYHDTLGFNFRMNDIEAAIGIEQLKKLPRENKARINNAQYLNRIIRSQGIVLPTIPVGYTHVFHQYTIRVTQFAALSRAAMIKNFMRNKIETRIFYPLPIYRQKAYRRRKFRNLKLPVTERVTKEVLSIPIHSLVSHQDLVRIASIIRSVPLFS